MVVYGVWLILYKTKGKCVEWKEREKEDILDAIKVAIYTQTKSWNEQ